MCFSCPLLLLSLGAAWSFRIRPAAFECTHRLSRTRASLSWRELMRRWHKRGGAHFPMHRRRMTRKRCATPELVGSRAPFWPARRGAAAMPGSVPCQKLPTATAPRFIMKNTNMYHPSACAQVWVPWRAPAASFFCSGFAAGACTISTPVVFS